MADRPARPSNAQRPRAAQAALPSRCPWCGEDPLYVAYHDEEWGRPTSDDRYVFEKIVLEGFQSGLSWLTILRKREGFRRAFAEFELDRLVRFGPRDVERLLLDASIVRHRGKIESALNNARQAVELRERHGSLAEFVRRFAPERPAPPPRSMADLLPQTAESKALSKALRKLGWSYVGPTTLHAMMQATGVVNDHLESCGWRALCSPVVRRAAGG